MDMDAWGWNRPLAFPPATCMEVLAPAPDQIAKRRARMQPVAARRSSVQGP